LPFSSLMNMKPAVKAGWRERRKTSKPSDLGVSQHSPFHPSKRCSIHDLNFFRGFQHVMQRYFSWITGNYIYYKYGFIVLSSDLGASAMSEEKRKRRKYYGTTSIPMGVLEDIDKLTRELRYWPSRAAFVREACIEKIRREQERLKQLRETTNGAPSPRRAQTVSVLEEKSK